MEWLVVFAAGAAVGLAIWPLMRVSGQVPVFARWLRDPLSYLRFQRAFGIAPSRDADIHKLLQPTVDKHLSYLREAAMHAAKDLERLQSGQARSLIDASRTASRLRRTKKRLNKVSKQMTEATALALAWGFPVEAPLRPGPSEGAIPLPAAPQRAARRRRTAVAATPSGDGTPATS
jgi:hypothetical protein